MPSSASPTAARVPPRHPGSPSRHRPADVTAAGHAPGQGAADAVLGEEPAGGCARARITEPAGPATLSSETPVYS
jgi:hypothetical protein